jgi:hypothetical protein
MGPAALIIRGLPAEFFQVTNKRFSMFLFGR